MSYDKGKKMLDKKKTLEMEGLAITFVWLSIIVVGMIIWVNTKSGQKWLNEL